MKNLALHMLLSTHMRQDLWTQSVGVMENPLPIEVSVMGLQVMVEIGFLGVADA